MSSEDSPFLGGGAYGKVFEARRSSLCAIKVIPYEQTIPVNAIREIATLRRLERTDGRERFARLLDVDFRQQEVVLTLQYGRRGNLAERLEEAQPPMSKKLLWAAQLMEGLETLHRENLLHRDLKPENIVLTDRDDLKLIDFGLSRPFLTDEPLTPLVCTLYYRPPEILVQTIMSYGDGGGGVVYGTEVDCWSAGCVLRELATGRGPEFRPAVPSPNLVASSEQQLQSILGRFGYDFSAWDSDEVAIFCKSTSVLVDVSTPSITENALREVSRGLLVPNPPSRLTSGEARQLLRQVDVLGRLEGCALQAASFNFGLPLRPRPFYGDSVLRREEAPEKEKGELTRLLKRIEPDMADFLDSLVFGAKPGKVTYGEALSRARDRMAILWPALRDIHLRVTGRECAPPGPALLGSHLRAAGGEHAPPAGAAVVA